MTLFDMTEEFSALLAGIEAEEPSLETLDAMAKIEANIKTKADGYCSLIRHYEAMFTANALEAERLAKRASDFKRKQEWLKFRLHDALVRLGELKIQTATNTITVCKNGGKTPIDIAVAAESLPEVFQSKTTVIKPNSEAIREALEQGHPVPGCSLKEHGTHLRIR